MSRRYGGRRYYDALTARCASCGWRAVGEYLDGRPYVECIRYGYILHEPVETDCEDWRTPEQVGRYLAEQEERSKKTHKKKKQ